MISYAVRAGRLGWYVDNGAVCYGPYKREDKAVAAAESLNRQQEERAPHARPRDRADQADSDRIAAARRPSGHAPFL